MQVFKIYIEIANYVCMCMREWNTMNLRYIYDPLRYSETQSEQRYIFKHVESEKQSLNFVRELFTK